MNFFLNTVFMRTNSNIQRTIIYYILKLFLFSKPTDQLLTNFAKYLPFVFTKIEKYSKR